MQQRQFLTISLILPAFCFAGSKNNDDLDKHLQNFLSKYNVSSNVSKGAMIDGQRAGYATGGSIVIRNRANITQPLTVNVPKIDAGCGGIDIYAGGFSFVNKDELVNTLKDIGANSVGYAFLLGLETISPLIANNIKELQSWANQANQIGINSCEVATTLVDSVWPAKQAAKEKVCQITGTNENRYSDQITARQNCKNEVEIDESINSAQNKNHGLLIDNYNVAWEAIKSQKLMDQDDELMEMMMTLIGTIIIQDSSKEKVKPTIFQGKIFDDGFYKKLLVGGEIPIYRCQDRAGGKNKCLLVEKSTLSLPYEKSWVGQIHNHLANIQSKIINEKNGTSLTDAEIEVMTKTHLPLFHIVNVLTAYSQGECSSYLGEVAEIVAADLLMQFLNDAVITIREGCRKLSKEQYYATEIKDYQKEVEHAQEQLRFYELRENTLEREYHLLQKIDLLERKITEQIKLF